MLLIVATKEWNVRQTTVTHKSSGKKIVKDIKRDALISTRPRLG